MKRKKNAQEWAAFKKVRDFFQEDFVKTILWFSLPNPHFGNMSPLDLVKRGRGFKVIQFIESAIKENKK